MIRSISLVLVLALIGLVSAQQHSNDNSLTIPAGTQIKVDVSEENPPRNVQHTFMGKVVVPVQVAGTVVIPALTKVIIRVSPGYDNTGAQEVMELIEVILETGRYPVTTDRVPVSPGSVTEMTFTLLKDVTIKR